MGQVYRCGSCGELIPKGANICPRCKTNKAKVLGHTFDLAQDFGMSPAEIAKEEAEEQARAARRKAQIEARQARTQEVLAKRKKRGKTE